MSRTKKDKLKSQRQKLRKKRSGRCGLLPGKHRVEADVIFARTGIRQDENAFEAVKGFDEYPDFVERVVKAIPENQEAAMRDRARDFLTRKLLIREINGQ